MPKKAKTPEFSDWHVALGDGSFSESLVARASSLMVIEGSYVLRDTYGGILFAAPAAAVRYIRRLEPGLDVPAVNEKPKAAAAPETRGGYRGGSPASEVAPPRPLPSGSMLAPALEPDSAAAEKAVPDDPGPVEVAKPQRSRSAKRGR